MKIGGTSLYKDPYDEDSVLIFDLAIILENLKNGYNMQVHLVKLGDNSIQVSSNKKGNLKLMSCLLYVLMIYMSYFLNFFLPNPARPISPEPNRSMVAGSGTGEDVP